MPSAANLVRGNDVRIGGARVGSVDAITRAAPARRHEHRRARPQARARRRAAAARLDGAHPPALGARPQVRRDHARHVGRGLRRRRHDPARRRPRRRRSSSTSSSTCSTTPTRARHPGQPARLRRRASPAAATSLNQAIGAFAPLLRDVVPVAAQPRRARTPTCARFIARAGATPRASSRPPPRRRRSSSSDLDRTFAALRAVRAVHPGGDQRGPGDARRRHPRPARSSARSWPTPRRLVPRAAARRRARCAAPRRTLADAVEVGTPALRAHAGAQRAARVAARDGAGVRRGPARAARPRAASPRPRTRSSPTLAFVAPAQTTCNYIALFFRNIASLLSEGDAQRHLAALHHRRHAAGPEQRGHAVLRAGQRAERGQPPAHQPVPEHRLARPAARVRGRQRAVPGGPDRDVQPAGHASRRRRRGKP